MGKASSVLGVRESAYMSVRSKTFASLRIASFQLASLTPTGIAPVSENSGASKRAFAHIGPARKNPLWVAFGASKPPTEFQSGWGFEMGVNWRLKGARLKSNTPNVAECSHSCALMKLLSLQCMFV